MRRRWATLILITILAGLFWNETEAGTYTLTTGQSFTGEPLAPTAEGVVLKLGPTRYSDRIPWTNFTEESLNALAEDPNIRPFVSAYMFKEPPLEDLIRKRPPIQANTVTRIPRPDPGSGLGSLFTSPISILLVALLYGANLFAGYTVGVFRNYQPMMVTLVSAVLPLIGPVIFLCMPTNLGTVEEEEEELTEEEEQAMAEAAAIEAAAKAPPPIPEATPVETPPEPEIPKEEVYERGQFTFNRRFFETKFAGFLRAVPGDAESEKVIAIESVRGDFTCPRLAKVTPSDVVLLVAKGGATNEVSIPFTEVKKVTIKHKDAP